MPGTLSSLNLPPSARVADDVRDLETCISDAG